MEAAAGRGGSLPMASSSSQPPRKEWRAISEHSFRNNNSEECEHVKLGQSDERTIYEVQEGVGALEADFCAITIDGGSDDVLQQRLRDISRRRQELQQMEIEMRAQAIARSEIVEVQNSYESRLKEHANAAAKLKEQLQEREQYIHELELKMEEKDRELRAVNTEAAWAKEDFLREQNEKLATFRRERDNSEAEKAQHLKQIHDLQQHIKEKEGQFLALEEQHRVGQDTILFKDEQLREAQAWITRFQEMGALQSSSLQAELQERTEQFHQYCMGFQRQFLDMERHHMHAIQQLQLELAEARGQNGTQSDSSQAAHGSPIDSSVYIQNQGNQNNADDGSASNGNPRFMSNGKLDGTSSSVSLSGISTKAEHVHGIPLVPSSVVRVDGFLPPGQVNPLPPVLYPQSGVPQPESSTNTSIPASHMAHFQPLTAIGAHQHWQNQQVVPEVLQIPSKNEHQISQADYNQLESSVHYGYERPSERQEIDEDRVNTHINQGQTSDAMINGSNEVVESNGKQYQMPKEPKETIGMNSTFHATFAFDRGEQKSELKVENNLPSVKQPREQVNMSQPWSASNVPVAVAQNNTEGPSNVSDRNRNITTSTEGSVPALRTSSSSNAGKAMEPALLDERSLLACIVRAIPAGSGNGIRISTTLPNRLGKMLAPLHWHDYKKQYGKLDDFVSHHPELFVIEGDFIHLRDGAQEIISATTAVAKVAAAAASAAPYSSLLPSVAVTPVAHNNRLKKVALADSGDKHTQLSKMQNQHLNGVNINVVQGMPDVKVLSKEKDLQDSDNSSQMRHGHAATRVVADGLNFNRTVLPPSQNKVLSNGRHADGGRRLPGSGSISRR